MASTVVHICSTTPPRAALGSTRCARSYAADRRLFECLNARLEHGMGSPVTHM